MRTAIAAGAAYFVLVFTAGFLLGVLRALLLAPLLGETPAVVVELPVILAVSWLACAWLIRRFAVPPALAPRAVMGAAAFALLIAAEFGLAALAFGRTPAEHLQTYRSLAGLLGLAGQLAFATFPVIHARCSSRRPGG